MERQEKNTVISQLFVKNNIQRWIGKNIISFLRNPIIRKCVDCGNTLPRRYVYFSIQKCRICVERCKFCKRPVDVEADERCHPTNHNYMCDFVGYTESICGKFVPRGYCRCDICNPDDT